MNQETQRQPAQSEIKETRRPYAPPAFIASRGFERQSLSCAGGMVSSNAQLQGCTFKS
ncbi:MAG: hypothetical protein VYD19_04480 [Myxococcota bacterium]|nr:hypothetical protein [Myxococcota bacterium]